MTRKPLLLATCFALLVAGSAAGAPPRRTRPLLFVPSFSSNIVTVFDLRTNARVASIGLGARGACCAYASPDQRTVYVVGGLSPEVTEIDTRTLAVRRVIDTPGVSGDHGSAMPRDGRLFFAGGARGVSASRITLSVITGRTSRGGETTTAERMTVSDKKRRYRSCHGLCAESHSSPILLRI